MGLILQLWQKQCSIFEDIFHDFLSMASIFLAGD